MNELRMPSLRLWTCSEQLELFGEQKALEVRLLRSLTLDVAAVVCRCLYWGGRGRGNLSRFVTSDDKVVVGGVELHASASPGMKLQHCRVHLVIWDGKVYLPLPDEENACQPGKDSHRLPQLLTSHSAID